MNAGIQAIIRHSLTIMGGWLTAKGISVTDGDVEVLAGAASIILGVTLSLLEKRKRD